MSSSYTGPRIGDMIKIEVPGRVLELQAREHVLGALIELASGELVWRPLDEIEENGR